MQIYDGCMAVQYTYTLDLLNFSYQNWLNNFSINIFFGIKNVTFELNLKSKLVEEENMTLL